MREFHFKTLTFSLLVLILLCGSSFELSLATRAWHSRPDSRASNSLTEKVGKSHGGQSHGYRHGSKPKAKSPPYKPPPSVAPPPSKGGSRHGSKPKAKSPPYKPPPSVAPPPSKGGSSAFNVLRFGAKGDGTSDDTKAFEAAWAATCKVEASTLIVPSGYRFLVGPISFSGPYCLPNIVFQLDGTIVAPTSPKVWGSGLLWWLEFTKLKGITVQGSGTIDGSGSVWWASSAHEGPTDSVSRLLAPFNYYALESPPTQVRSKLVQRMPSMKPTALRFYGSFNVTVMGITIQNSQQCHLKFDNCVGVAVHDVNISSPAKSPNTDGIHLQNTQQADIHHADIACGDDCISIQTGCSEVYIHNVNCGPGHGISIGGLGKDNSKACVSNVTVRDVAIHSTMTGVRIKTWQGGSGSVQGVLFSNIQVREVQLPIVIDQFYCDKWVCKNQTTAVAVSAISYEGIRGTYTYKPVHLACSDNLPCTGLTLTAIQLRPQLEQHRLYDPFCSQAYGELTTPTVPPISCLQLKKPPKSLVQSQLDACEVPSL